MFEITFIDEEHHRKFTFDNVDEILIDDRRVKIRGHDFMDNEQKPYSITTNHDEYTYMTIYQD